MNFKKQLCLEVSRLFHGLKAIILILFFLLTLYFIQFGINQYKGSLEEIKRFQEFEKAKVKQFQHYGQYGTYGFRLYYNPGPMGSLFALGGVISTDLNAYIDVGERLKIHEPFQGKDAFIGYTGVFKNITGFLFWFGSIIALFYGLEAYRDKEFLKFLVNMKGSRKNIFWSILGTRLILLGACCLALAAITWAMFMINGLNPFLVGQLVVYYLINFIMLAFFLLAGLAAGSLQNKVIGISVALAFWFFFVFFLPVAVDNIVNGRADSITSTYEIEIEKLKLMMIIEKKAKDQAGKLDPEKTNTEIRRQLHEYFWKNEFNDIFKREQSMINEMRSVVIFHHNLSLIFPTSFILSADNEICGRGYENLIAFYEYVLKHKKGFIQYYAEKSFYKGDTKVEPYLKGNSNIYYADSQLPVNFGFGLLITFLWLVGLLFFSWLAFTRMLNRQPMEGKEADEPKTEEIKKNRITLVFTTNQKRRAQLFSRLKVEKKDFVSVPSPSGLPKDVRVKELLAFFGLPLPEALNRITDKYCGPLSLDDQARLILEIIRPLPEEYVIFNNFLVGLSENFKIELKSFLDDHKKDRWIAYFSNSLYAATVCDDCISYSTEEHQI